MTRGDIATRFQKGNPGRRSQIDFVVRHDEFGEPVTVADAIIEGCEAGLYLEPSIAATGVSKSAVYGWMKTAGLARLRAHGHPEIPDLTDNEAKCVAFLDALEKALGMYELVENKRLGMLAEGGIVQEVVTIKVDADGKEEVTTRTSRTLPDAKVIMWRLEKRFPARYGQRIQVSDASEAEVSIEDRAAALLVTAREMDDRRRAEKGPARPRKVAPKKP